MFKFDLLQLVQSHVSRIVKVDHRFGRQEPHPMQVVERELHEWTGGSHRFYICRGVFPSATGNIGVSTELLQFCEEELDSWVPSTINPD